MDQAWMPEIVGVCVSLMMSAIGWIVADTRSKSRLTYAEEKLYTLRKAADSALDQCSHLALDAARSQQDRQEIHRIMDRLDSQKASKEIVDGFRAEVANLRIDMDKRFDRIERMLSKGSPNV